MRMFSTRGGGGGKTWYVRPSGGTYGAEDGTSYDTAWDGFTNIDWTANGVKAGDTLYVCGTHTEAFVIGGSGTSELPITIRGDYAGDAGVIDSEDTRNIGMQISSKNYITLTSLSLIDAVVTCLDIIGTSTGIITNDCIFTGSGNQGIQHSNSASATHNNPTCTGNVDDGISGRDSATIVVNGGTISNNAEGINVSADVTCTITGSPTFSGNTSHDIHATNATTDESCIINITGATIPVKATATNGAKLIMTDCIVSGALDIASSGNGFLVGSGNTYSGAVTWGDDAVIDDTDSDYTGTLTAKVDAILAADGCNFTPYVYLRDVTATGCVFNSLGLATGGTLNSSLTNCLVKVWGNHIYGTVTITDCVILDNASVYGDLTITRSLIDGVNSDDHLFDIQSGGSIDSKYNIFKGMIAIKFAINVRTGATATIENNTIVGSAGVGRGIYAQVDITVSNNILTDLDDALWQNAGTFTANNNCLYDNGTDITGTITNNNPVTTDPLLADVANNDYSLGAGSDCIEAGATLTEATGIDTATWGNESDETPTVTTKEQSASWDIGAYID